MKKNYNLGEIEQTVTGMDAFFASEPTIVTPVGQPSTAPVKVARTKIGSLQQLGEFQRISSETLIHKSTQDLWAIRQEGEDFFIERLFQDNGAPLKD